MARGAVKWFHAIMGYGFIAPADGSSSIRIASDGATDVVDGLRPGTLVEYDTATAPDGQPRAVNLRVIAEAAAPA